MSTNKPSFSELLKSKWASFRTYWQQTPTFRWVTYSLSGLIFMAATGAFALLLMVYTGFFGALPTQSDLANIENAQASEIYDSEEVLLGKYYLQERTNIQYKDLSPYLVEALVSTEDARFYEHSGVDYRSLGRVFFRSLLLGDESSGGGSTISQQLAKNLYTRQDHGWLSMPVNKIREILIAKRLEEAYSKEEIITLYFNTVPFGGGAFGIETASDRFFSKSPLALLPQEAAVLVGMLKATNYYNPKLNPERAIARRNIVLSQMAKFGDLAPTAADSLKELPLALNYQRADHNEGLATYFREQLRLELNDWLRLYNANNGTSYDLYTDGLKIYTTLNAEQQAHAEAAMYEQMAILQRLFNKHWENRDLWKGQSQLLQGLIKQTEHYKSLKSRQFSESEIMEIFNRPENASLFSWQGEKEVKISPIDSIKHYLSFLNAGLLSIAPQTGEVKAWVGGIDHRYFQYDHVNRKAKRQVGSIMKPIIYASALEQGATPCEYVPNELVTYEEYEHWTPQNADREYGGLYSMQGALVNSINTVSVQLLLEYGMSEAVGLAKNMGITAKIDTVPSLALGAADVSLYEMVQAYACFANGGVSVPSYYLEKVTTKKGEVLFEASSTRQKSTRVMSRETASIMLKMMESVVNRGTAASLRSTYGLPSPIAGKTGTTQNQTDGWFIGITPELVTGVWVGGEYPFVRFNSLSLGQGGKMALPIWARYHQNLFKDPEFSQLANAQFHSLHNNNLPLMDCEDFMEKESKPVKEFLELFFGSKEVRQQRKEERRKRREERREKRKRDN